MADKHRAKSQRVDHGGNYRMIPVSLLESDAWNGLTMRARCIALALIRRFSGFNNGAIAASARDIADAIGSHRYAANRAAIGELINAGIITIERIHPQGSRMATEYRLTFVESGRDGHRKPATNEWRSIKAGNRWKNSPDETSTRNWKRVDAPSDDRKRRVDAPSTDVTETSQKLAPVPVDALSTLIGSHSEQSFPLGSTPAFLPDFTRGQIREPCTMELDELRAFATGYLSGAEPGAQTKLAAAARVPGGTLSKFLAGKGLPSEHRLNLQLAVGRAWPMEQRPVVVKAA